MSIQPNTHIGGKKFQMILLEGYAYESHFVTTDDGYIINNIRVKHIKEANTTNSKGVIILLHGLHTDASTWTIFGKDSLAFFLVDQGYDIWLYNSRGTVLSHRHKDPNINYNDYWDFSFHEMGLYDISATVGQISEITKSKEIILMGHSMGSTVSLIYSILRKAHAETHVKAVIALAPITYLRLVDNHVLALGLFAHPATYFMNFTGIAVFNENKYLNKQAIKYCSGYPSVRLCYRVMTKLMTIDGVDHGRQILPEMIPCILSAIGSVMAKTDEHFGQIVSSGGNFQQFDYGSATNLIKYGSFKPPTYNVSDISTPVYLFYAENDPFSTREDTKYLYDLIGSKKKVMLTSKTTSYFNHYSFIFSKDIRTIFFPPLVNILNNL